ncbi:MAG: hypothetical protein QM661_14190, partial [Solimonas sp.]
MTNGAARSRHLVAPELAPGLDRLPQLDLSDDGLAAIRRGSDAPAMARPPLSAALQAVACEERHVPGPA